MEAFKIKNGLSAKRYLGSTTTLSGSTIDLSLSSMFSTTLSSDPAYTFTNPPASGNAQAFSVEVTGGTTTFTQDSFATTLYTGNATARSISNGLDLSSDGGLVWAKSRSTRNHILSDTERGTGRVLFSNSHTAEDVDATTITSYNSDGFTMGSSTLKMNTSGEDFVAWSFKKQAKFFDIVTYTGNNSVRTIAHNLGVTPGMIVTKRIDSQVGGSWYVYHREGTSTDGERGLVLNTDDSQYDYNDSAWDISEMSSTHFGIGSSNETNGQDRLYVAYLFAHDTASDSRVKCDSYTGGGNSDVEVNLGWKPQWLLIRRSDAAEDWFILDTARGLGSDGDPNAILEPNLTDAETSSSTRVAVTDTGFFTTANTGAFNASGGNYIYIAIRASTATDSAITWPSSVKWPSGVAPTTPAPGTKDLFTFLTTDGGTTYYGKKAAEGLA